MSTSATCDAADALTVEALLACPQADGLVVPDDSGLQRLHHLHLLAGDVGTCTQAAPSAPSSLRFPQGVLRKVSLLLTRTLEEPLVACYELVGILVLKVKQGPKAQGGVSQHHLQWGDTLGTQVSEES